MEIQNVPLVAEIGKLLSTECFGKNVSSLLVCLNMGGANITCKELLSDTVTIYFNMLRLLMKDGVGSDMKGNLIVTIKLYRTTIMYTKR